MVNRTIIALLASALISPVPCGHAQRMPESVLRLRPGTTLRVQTGSFGRRDGRFLRVTGDTLFLFAQGSEMVVAMHDLQALWQRGRATKTGALVTGLVVAAGTGTFAGLLCGGWEGGTCTSRVGAVAVGAAIGAAGGVLIGGVIGAAIPKWHRRYP